MIKRSLQNKLLHLSTQFPVLGIIGPRQSGKTTLVRNHFSHKPYVSLEDIDQRTFAHEDPRGFLDMYPNGAILDEIQNVPSLLSYIQSKSDQDEQPGQYILTGSQNFLMLENVTQTLAGRIALLTLLPFSYEEIKSSFHQKDVSEIIYQGFFPRSYMYDIDPLDFYPNYISTYIERDIRQLQNVQDLTKFHKLIKLCAGRVGQLLNYSALAEEAGIAVPTVKSWISLLEASFIIHLVPPYFQNFNKRLVKMPKLYFIDTGVACSLLDIQSSDQLQFHYAKGELFENFIMMEVLKHQYNTGNRANLYFWRDKTGHEVDCLLDQGHTRLPIEIKPGKTIINDFFKNLTYFAKQANQDQTFLIYGGDIPQKRGQTQVIPWHSLPSLFTFS